MRINKMLMGFVCVGVIATGFSIPVATANDGMSYEISADQHERSVTAFKDVWDAIDTASGHINVSETYPSVNWGGFADKVVDIYISATDSETFKENYSSYYNTIIGGDTVLSEKERAELPNIFFNVGNLLATKYETEIAEITEPITEPLTIPATDIVETTSVETNIETTTFIETTTATYTTVTVAETTTYTDTTTTNTESITNTTNTTDTTDTTETSTNTTTVYVAGANTSTPIVTSAKIEDEVPQTGDKGVIGVIIGAIIALGVAVIPLALSKKND